MPGLGPNPNLTLTQVSGWGCVAVRGRETLIIWSFEVSRSVECIVYV